MALLHDTVAVCADDGRMLAATAAVTVIGPVAVTVADAEIREDAHLAAVEFPITVNRGELIGSRATGGFLPGVCAGAPVVERRHDDHAGRRTMGSSLQARPRLTTTP